MYKQTINKPSFPRYRLYMEDVAVRIGIFVPKVLAHWPETRLSELPLIAIQIADICQIFFIVYYNIFQMFYFNKFFFNDF
jgi:hypothetical protein